MSITPDPLATSEYWLHEDGFDETFLYIEPKTEKFLGRVRGSRFKPFDGWTAFAYTLTDEKYFSLGTYATVLGAKAAVIEWVNKEKEANRKNDPNL